MTPTDHQDPQLPPPPPFATSVDLDPSTEVDVDLGAEHQQLEGEQVLSRDTMPEGVECVGDYPTVALYLRAQLEDQVSDSCQWLLDHLDYAQVRERWESDGSRLICESGCVYRIAPPEPDPPGPWMPTRGA